MLLVPITLSIWMARGLTKITEFKVFSTLYNVPILPFLSLLLSVTSSVSPLAPTVALLWAVLPHVPPLTAVVALDARHVRGGAALATLLRLLPGVVGAES